MRERCGVMRIEKYMFRLFGHVEDEQKKVEVTGPFMRRV